MAAETLGPPFQLKTKPWPLVQSILFLGVTAEAASRGLREWFQAVVARKDFAESDVAGGREYVEAYLGLLKYVEGLREAEQSDGHGRSQHSDAAKKRCHIKKGQAHA